MVSIVRYHPDQKHLWDSFVESAANATFLHRRDYMEYHQHRFVDHSILVMDRNKLVAILPCNKSDQYLYSHGGLTYGGLLTQPGIKTTTIIDLFTELQMYCRDNEIQGIYYKPVPGIFQRHRTESDLYAVYQSGGQLVGRDICTAIQLNSYQIPSKKLSGARKARAAGIEVVKSEDFSAFFDIVNEGLQSKYGVTATHTAEEMQYLYTLFPRHIQLITAVSGTKIYGGLLLYAAGQTLHAQYIAVTQEGKKVRCLDLLIQYITSTAGAFDWFSFGISSEHKGEYTNTSLLSSKEEFFTSPLCFDYYFIPASPEIKIGVRV